jgi:hypothetical protein
MASKTFSIGFGVTITLTEVAIDGNGLPGVQIDISGTGQDITAVLFDLADDSDLSSYVITEPVLSNSFEYEVTDSDFATDSVDTIGGVNLNPARGFDGGVAIADTGSTFVGATSFVVRGENISLADF